MANARKQATQKWIHECSRIESNRAETKQMVKFNHIYTGKRMIYRVIFKQLTFMVYCGICALVVTCDQTYVFIGTL